MFLSPGISCELSRNSTQTISPLGNFIAEGFGGFPIEIKSNQLGTQATLHKDGDPVCLDFLYMTDIAATGTGFSYAGANSDDVFNNSGWLFQACPPCFYEPPLPAPILDPASITTVLCSGQASLILADLPSGYEAVWFDANQMNELYASTANLFEPLVNQSTILFGAFRDLSTGCVSDLLEVQVIVVNDPPIALCQDITITLGSGECDTPIVPSDIDAGSSDDCGIADLEINPMVCPIGQTIVTLTVTDNIGQTSICTATVTVLEFPNPITSLVCNDLVIISVDNNCAGCLNPEDALEGGPYHCFDDYIIEIDKTLPYGNGPWVPACVGSMDIGKTYQYRVTDPDTGNKCWGNVKIDDNIKPVCQPPASVTLSCEGFDPSLMAYPAVVSDNCCLDATREYQGKVGLSHVANYSQFDTVCNKGTLNRTFTAYDCTGNTSSCTQRIIVNYQQDYFVHFPNDVIVTACDGTGLFGEPSFFGLNCELMGVSYEDVVFIDVPDVCYEIERTWTILNWCTYNPNLDCINVPNPTPNAIPNHPSNLPGPIVSACGTSGSWAPTVVKINPSDPTPTNYCSFWQLNANCYKYKQIIKIDDQQAPVVNCPSTIEINLEGIGRDTLALADINFTYSDNCSPNDLFVLPFQTLYFDCDDQGTSLEVEISVRDICDNVGTCTIEVVVLTTQNCGAVSISDPCGCKNNATTLTNGQFEETIKIISSPGKTWTLIANTGLYSTGSPAPPAAPILIPLGATFTEIPNQSGEYYLTGIHVDAQGYSIIAESETGEILTIGNQCEYPNPEISSDLSGVYCVFSDPVDLTGIPGDNNIITEFFTVNGGQSSQFDPSQGPGTYEIVYIVDGGTAKAFGPDDPGCVSTISVNVVVNPIPTIICPDDVTVNADPGLCSTLVNDLEPVINEYGCPVMLTYHIDGIFGTFNGDASGRDFNVGSNSVSYYLTGNGQYVASCGFYITVLDIEAPDLQCVSRTLENDPGMCSRLIADNSQDATATDNCPGPITLTHNYPPAPNNNTLAGATFPVGTTQVIWTATDASGNQSTCLQEVTIEDTEDPVFLDCPAQMIMVGNDPDQCSAKINWSPPAAVDNCGIPVVMQVGGPPSGSVIQVVCPPMPTLITYLATDGSANTTICSFEIMVIDSERPEFDADIIMPNDTTVNCHQVPANCVYHGPLICTPLTSNDVHDNCTSPADLEVDYNEASTKNPDPSVCGHYDYDLTRTWTVTDCANNALVHVQEIEVQDTTKSVAICRNDTITLNDFGTFTILPRDLDRGSWDNCAANANLTFTASQTVFSCADLPNSPVPVTLTVTDPCGNFSTCTAFVTIWEGNGKCIPEYDFDGSDPCACLDNATTLDNGQFSELIQIQSLAGQTWTIVSSSGLYLVSSPAPPAAPIPVANGTIMTNGQFDGYDNDGDLVIDELDERVYYTFRGRHVDGQGYFALLRSNLNQEITLENKCYYPTPYFIDFVLNDPLCIGTPPFTIAVGEFNNATGMIVPGSVMVNGVVTTVFDAGALGVGNHTVMATFDAFDAQPFTKVNGVMVAGSEQAAQNDPGCKQKITKIVNVVATPTTLICNDLVHVSMDADCQVTTLVDDVLEGTYFCYDDYTVEVDKTPPYGNGPWIPATFNSSDIGKTYQYRVVHTSGGNNICWGEIKIEDKLAPALDCPADITIACSEPTDISHTGNVVISDCSSTTTVLANVVVDHGECGDPRQIITRKFIVTDAWGNQSICDQTITVRPFDLADLVMPADITIDCESAYLNPLATQPAITGQPSINGAPIGTNLCSATFGFTDVVLNGCSGSTEILRTWTVKNSCLPLSSTNPATHTQVIRVKDFSGPAFVCPPAVTVSNDPFSCCATAALPGMIVSEGCSNISNLEALVTGTNPNNGNIITFTVGGHLTDFPGNNWWNPDTLAVFDYTQCLPLGVYQVTYSAADACGNLSNCNFELTVADLVPPAVACDQLTQVALTADGMAVVNASTFDDGTTDNCCLEDFEVRRMNANPCEGNSFGPSVSFCCSDLGDTILVVFRANDCHGNSNDCMVSVLVEDKIKPTCQAPAQMLVNCENFDPSLWAYGFAFADDNCCLDTITTTTNYALFDTVCNKGTITRTFRAFDCANNSSQCTQRVIVNYLQDYFVKFPNDAIVTVCDGTGLYGEPVFFGEDCELLGVTYADEIFTVVPDACFKIERTWSIINWCTFNPNLPFIDVPNPNPNATTNHPSNLPGPTVSACGTLAPWAPTVVKINPTDPTATNFCTFWDANANGYRYKQIIKIIDGQAPTGTYVTPTCDNQNWLTANHSGLWNESEWWNNGFQTHDLCEEPTDLCITGTDACSGSNVNIEYLLFLDMDGDGVMETVINSVNTGIAGLGWNNVLFNNLNTPNFAGGTPRNFDERPVPANQKYGFAIQETVVGNNKTACVRWNTQQAQNTFVAPEMPHGTHKIKWLISDGCGNNQEYEYTFTVKDCKAPTVVCLNGLSVNTMPTAMIQLWATDFLQYTEDNCTPAGQIQLGIRKCGQGTGFPLDANGNQITNVTFDCTELGTQCVELWSIDAAGNADYCETYVIVQDNLGNCPSADHINVAGALKTEIMEGVEEGSVHIDGTSTFAPPYSYFDLSDTLGTYAVINSVPLASTFVIAPEKDDNPLNGVTTYDLVLISKHILGIEPLNTPYKMIAADANKSGSITTFDIVELRKLILGIYTELPNNTSWRFVDKAFQFPNLNNPFQTLFPETISVADAMATQAAKDFVGVKVGDVNNTSVANATMQAEDRTSATALFDIEDQDVSAGEEFEVTFRSAQQLKGFQFTMLLNGLEAVGAVESDNVTASNFGMVFENAMTVSIDGAQEFTLRFRALKSGKLREMLGVSGSITRAEAYTANDAMTNDAMTRLGIAFRFDGKTIAGVGFELYQNQPNPFVNRTFIGFFLPEADEATLSVYDETGRLVYQQKGQFAKGDNTIALDRALLNSTGMLFYKLETSTDSATKKMIQAK
ncbi:MAG: HYR domain-containing protein [Saprospiraceae bacterium]|nr:HYR domain-containing protein [Saprospiraceae bacterium]